MYSVKIEIFDVLKVSVEVVVEIVGMFCLFVKNLKNVELKCLKIVEKVGIAVSS